MHQEIAGKSLYTPPPSGLLMMDWIRIWMEGKGAMSPYTKSEGLTPKPPDKGRGRPEGREAKGQPLLGTKLNKITEETKNDNTINQTKRRTPTERLHPKPTAPPPKPNMKVEGPKLKKTRTRVKPRTNKATNTGTNKGTKPKTPIELNNPRATANPKRRKGGITRRSNPKLQNQRWKGDVARTKQRPQR